MRGKSSLSRCAASLIRDRWPLLQRDPWALSEISCDSGPQLLWHEHRSKHPPSQGRTTTQNERTLGPLINADDAQLMHSSASISVAILLGIRHYSIETTASHRPNLFDVIYGLVSRDGAWYNSVHISYCLSVGTHVLLPLLESETFSVNKHAQRGGKHAAAVLVNELRHVFTL